MHPFFRIPAYMEEMALTLYVYQTQLKTAWLKKNFESIILRYKFCFQQSDRTQVRSHRSSIVLSHAQNLECYTFQNKHHGFLRDAPIPLFNPSVAVLDNFMYACGGKYDSTENNEIATARCFRYDPRYIS